jgi:hypothetical protein
MTLQSSRRSLRHVDTVGACAFWNSTALPMFPGRFSTEPISKWSLET